MKEQLIENEAEFKAVFGRKRDGKDRLLFDSYFNSMRDYHRQTREVAEAAGVDQRLVFAWQRTGFMLSEANRHMAGPKEKKEWKNALGEYDGLTADGVNPFAVIDFRRPEEYFIFEGLKVAIRSAIVILGSMIHRNTHRKLDEARFLVLYFVARAHQGLRTCYHLLETRASGDVLAILRNIYESYLRVRAMRFSTVVRDSFMAQLLMDGNNYKYQVLPNGKINKNIIVQSRTGEKYPSFFSLKDLAKTSGAVDEVGVYEALSSYFARFTHVKAGDLPNYFSLEQGFQFHPEEQAAEAAIMATFVAMLFLDELFRWDGFEKKSHRDITTQRKRISLLLEEMEESFVTIELFPAEFKPLRLRIHEISKRSPD